MDTKLQEHLAKVLELIRNQQIFIIEDTLYTLDVTEQRHLPVENKVQKTQMYIHGEPIDIWKNQVQFIKDNPPANEDYYTKLELVNFWFDNKLPQALRQMFYRTIDGKIDISLLRIMFFRVLEKEGYINATTLARNYQGLYDIFLKNRGELGDSLEMFLIDSIGIDEDLVLFESDIHLLRGKRFDRHAKNLFKENCTGFTVGKIITITEKQGIRPDGLLGNFAIDFKLSALSSEEIRETKEYLIYRNHFEKVYLLYLFGSHDEKIQKDNVIQQSIFTWIEENKSFFGQAYNKVLEDLSTMAVEFDPERFHRDEEEYYVNILQTLLEAIEQDGITNHSQLADKAGYSYVSQILSGSFFKSYSLAPRVIEAYQKAKINESSFLAIDVNGQLHGPFLKYQECFDYLKGFDPFYLYRGGMGKHGPQRCLYKGILSYKGYGFIKGSDKNVKPINLDSILNHARNYLNQQYSLIFEISESTNEIECYANFAQVENVRNVDKRTIQSAIKNGKVYRGYRYYQITPKVYTRSEIRKLKQAGIEIIPLLQHFKEKYNYVLDKDKKVE